MQIAPVEMQESLNRKFPQLVAIDNMDEVPSCGKLSISVFDRWLNSVEAKSLLENVGEEVERERNERLDAANHVFADDFECLSYVVVHEQDGQKRAMFKEFETSEGLRRYFTQSRHGVSSQFLFKIVLPEISAVLYEGFDFTNHVYFRDETAVEEIVQRAKNAGLYILR